MLYFVLLLVAAALGGVVAALITANSLWAWISIGLSVLAGLVLLVDWWRRRSGGRPGSTAAAPAAPFEVDDETDDEAEAEETTEQVAVEPAASDEEPAAEGAAAPETEPQPEQSSESEEPAEAAEKSEVQAADALPGEEQTDAADALIVSDLDTEVLVVDEYPRYHLGVCGWLADRETIPIAVSEARELGFSPCARCEPDAELAAEHRVARNEFGTRADS